MRNGERAPGSVDTVTEAAALAALPGDLALPGDESRAERAPRRERGERNDRGDRPEGGRRERGDRRPRGESTDGIAGEAGTSGGASFISFGTSPGRSTVGSARAIIASGVSAASCARGTYGRPRLVL